MEEEWVLCVQTDEREGMLSNVHDKEHEHLCGGVEESEESAEEV